jgi:hypothetical protein
MRRYRGEGVRVVLPEIGQPITPPKEPGAGGPDRPCCHRFCAMRGIIITHHNGLTIADRPGTQQDRGMGNICNHSLLAT